MTNKWLPFVFCLFPFVLDSCTSSFRVDLNEQIETVLESNCDINDVEFKTVIQYLLSHEKEAAKLKLLTTDGSKVDVVALENYITVSKPYIKKKKNCSQIVINTGISKQEKVIEPKLYLERSGSMVYYDKGKSGGQFKDALSQLLIKFNYLKPEQSLIYVVNDNVYPCNMTFDALSREKDIFDAKETKKGRGEYTDFNKIFRNILDSLDEGQISIMFSDLIYSTRDMAEKNPKKILTEAENLTNNIFGSYADDYSVLVLKLNADYVGNYFTYENVAIPNYNNLRPYYVCFFAKNATMRDFLSNDMYKQVRDFSKLPEFENFYFFSNDKTIVNPYYSVLLKDADNKGRYNQNNDEIKEKVDYIHSIEGVTESNDGQLTINIATDLSKFMLPKDFLANTSNYIVDDLKDNFKVTKVQEIKDIPNVTHKITISTNKAGKGKRSVGIKLKKYFPIQWIIDSHSEDDRNTKDENFKKTTFGFKNMMNGIYKAYNPQNQEFYCTLNITLNN